uniref:Ig-like domain-containing protein n=1 Tax=Chelonoidis abingdonii TaxID=106734 RepID=A0A8C0QNA4_CHEAB
MAWAPLLLTYCSGVRSNSQPTLTQPPSASVSLGNTVKLSCTVSGSMNTIFWYQQKPGQAPRFVLYGTTSRGDGIPDRFTGSTSGNVGYLTVTNAQVEDEADYYCTMWGLNFVTWPEAQEVQARDRQTVEGLGTKDTRDVAPGCRVHSEDEGAPPHIGAGNGVVGTPRLPWGDGRGWGGDKQTQALFLLWGTWRV